MTLLLLLDDSGPPGLAANWPPFLTQRPGIHQGRLAPISWTPTQGDHAMVLGSDIPNQTGLFNIGDMIEVFQSETPANAAAKLTRFRGNLRSQQAMPAMSATETFNVTDGQTIEIAIDGGATQTITLDDSQFTSTAATAIELVPHINSQLSGAVASLNGDGTFSIWSNTTGRDTCVQVIGGTATAAIGLVELVWRAQLLIDGTVIASAILESGSERSLDDMGANVIDALAGAPFEIRFRLVLGAR